jgi:hypothetical protein
MRLAAFSLSFASMFAFASSVFALEPNDSEATAPLSDLHGREQAIEDLAPRRRAALVPLDPARAQLSVSFATRSSLVDAPPPLRRSAGRRDYAGSVLLSVPTDFGLAPAKAKKVDGDESAVDGSDEIMERAPRSDDPPNLLLVIRPKDARSAILAASRQRGHDGAATRLDALSSRARWSALLPRLRLRATRLIDESSSLSPTQYDANRITSSGGASLWLEARSTWQLDRLVFANEEVGIARMQRRLETERAASAEQTLLLLFKWQRALHRMYDPWLQPEQCLPALLDEEQLRITLDVETGGWLSRWLRDRSLDALDCSER